MITHELETSELFENDLKVDVTLTIPSASLVRMRSASTLRSGCTSSWYTTRGFRFILLFVLALAVWEYFCGFVVRNSCTIPGLLRNQQVLIAIIKNQTVIQNSLTTDTVNNVRHKCNITKEDFIIKEYGIDEVAPRPKILSPMADQGDQPVYVKTKTEDMKNLTTKDEWIKIEFPLPLCDSMPPELGPVSVNKTELTMELVEKKYPEVHWGGRYFPLNCTARHKVAIIVPYRDRQQHLTVFLNHMHWFLMQQQIEYGIFVIEQEGSKAFNRAKLFNVGFVESQKFKHGGWDCFILHDIDLLPLDTRNMYSCPRQPRHMSASVSKYNRVLIFEDGFGGVSAMSTEQFIKINGFSNKFWGWGGEDTDIYLRLQEAHFPIAKYKVSVARYTMLEHDYQMLLNAKRYELLTQSALFQYDGLSTLEYELVNIIEYRLYTHVLVNIDENFILDSSGHREHLYLFLLKIVYLLIFLF